MYNIIHSFQSVKFDEFWRSMSSCSEPMYPYHNLNIAHFHLSVLSCFCQFPTPTWGPPVPLRFPLFQQSRAELSLLLSCKWDHTRSFSACLLSPSMRGSYILLCASGISHFLFHFMDVSQFIYSPLMNIWVVFILGLLFKKAVDM